MAYQSVFARYESKYLLTAAQQERIKAAMAPHMAPDRYGPASYGIHGENALVFRSGDPESLHEMLVTALAEDHTLLCQNARRTALQYNPNHTDHILVDYFDSLPVWKE